MARQTTPLIEPTGEGDYWVTFLWRADETSQSVAVIQDWGADQIREHQMARLPRTDVWYKTRRFRADTRTTYQLSPSPSADGVRVGGQKMPRPGSSNGSPASVVKSESTNASWPASTAGSSWRST